MIRRKIILIFLLFISLNIFSQSNLCNHCKNYIDTVITHLDSNSYAWNGNTYYISGTYYYHTKNISGGDSIAKLNLKIYNTQKISRLELQEVYKTSKIFKDSIEQLIDSLESCLNPSDEDHSEKENIKFDDGVYHALLIGVEDYDDPLSDLNHPINDVHKLRDVLVNNYTFDHDNVRILENPKKVELEASLDLIWERIDKNDNVLIFFAGHGNFDSLRNQGYWYPADAVVTTNSSSTWVSNSFIKESILYLSKKSRNILLISDACFSGGILKVTRGNTSHSKNPKVNMKAIMHQYFQSSIRAMTSGDMSLVDDKSPFIHSFIQYLKNNNESCFTATTLYSAIKLYVIEESLNYQTPQFGTLHPDEGGDFIFIKK